MSIKEEIVNENHKPARKNFPRRKVEVRGLNEFLQEDLVEMIPFAKFIKGFRYILVVIEIFSKFVWIEPVKQKQGKDVTSVMKKNLPRITKSPKYLQTDNGEEFSNHNFKNMMESFKIHHFSSFSNLNVSVVERLNITLKRYMWKQFSLQGSYKWLNILSDIVNKYNNQKHPTIKIKPSQVTEKNEKWLLKNIYNTQGRSNGNYPKYIYREVFSKGPNWSNKVIKIRKVSDTTPTTYLLKDIQGVFYSEELQKTLHPDVYFK